MFQFQRDSSSSGHCIEVGGYASCSNSEWHEEASCVNCSHLNLGKGDVVKRKLLNQKGKGKGKGKGRGKGERVGIVPSECFEGVDELVHSCSESQSFVETGCSELSGNETEEDDDCALIKLARKNHKSRGKGFMVLGTVEHLPNTVEENNDRLAEATGQEVLHGERKKAASKIRTPKTPRTPKSPEMPKLKKCINDNEQVQTCKSSLKEVNSIFEFSELSAEAEEGISANNSFLSLSNKSFLHSSPVTENDGRDSGIQNGFTTADANKVDEKVGKIKKVYRRKKGNACLNDMPKNLGTEPFCVLANTGLAEQIKKRKTYKKRTKDEVPLLCVSANMPREIEPCEQNVGRVEDQTQIEVLENSGETGSLEAEQCITIGLVTKVKTSKKCCKKIPKSILQSDISPRSNVISDIVAKTETSDTASCEIAKLPNKDEGGLFQEKFNDSPGGKDFDRLTKVSTPLVTKVSTPKKCSKKRTKAMLQSKIFSENSALSDVILVNVSSDAASIKILPNSNEDFEEKFNELPKLTDCNVISQDTNAKAVKKNVKKRAKGYVEVGLNRRK